MSERESLIPFRRRVDANLAMLPVPCYPNGIVPWWKVSGSSTITAHTSFWRHFAMLDHFAALDADDE